jgi:hypothetical protein
MSDRVLCSLCFAVMHARFFIIDEGEDRRRGYLIIWGRDSLWQPDNDMAAMGRMLGI